MHDFTTNQDLMIVAGSGDVARIDGKQLPPILAQAGAEAWRHVVEYFTANIRNPNTRAAYSRAVISFFWWCEANSRHSLRELRPVDVATYVEEMAVHRAAPTVKQHLAAIRMLFDWLVVRQVLAMNPAAAVRGPRHVVKKGKTPVLRFPLAERVVIASLYSLPGNRKSSGTERDVEEPGSCALIFMLDSSCSISTTKDAAPSTVLQAISRPFDGTFFASEAG